MITIPIAVPNKLFQWQASLFQFAQEKVYGPLAYDNSRIVIVKQNHHNHPLVNDVNWDLRIPYFMVDSIYQANPHLSHIYNVAVNVLYGVKQILQEIPGDQVINIIDCDVIPLRPYTGPLPQENEMICCDYYNPWHMKLLPGEENYPVIEPYLTHDNHQYMNGGFVPMMIRKNTLAKVIDDAIEFSLKVVKENEDNPKGWWAAMFGLNAALHNHKVKMISQDNCYFPHMNEYDAEKHYWAHYSCDPKFHKGSFPNLNFKEFPHNPFYDMIRLWMHR
jgi:hypothetical protein